MSGGEEKFKFLAAGALRGVTIFDAWGNRIDNELGKRDFVTGTALEQGCDVRQGSRGATTDACQGSEVQQSWFIDEIIDITVSVERQKPSKSKRFQQTTIPQSEDPEDRGDSIQKIVEIHPEDHGGSPGWRIQKDVEVSQFHYTVDDAAGSSEDSADAAGTVR